jgi:hypothetical protein
MGMIDKSLAIKQTDHQIIDNSYRPIHGFMGHAGLIFLKSDVSTVIQAILYASFAAHNIKQPFWICIMHRQASQPILDFILNLFNG